MAFRRNRFQFGTRKNTKKFTATENTDIDLGMKNSTAVETEFGRDRGLVFYITVP
jgi:hypothetical protein